MISSTGEDCFGYEFIEANLSELRKVFQILHISTADVGAIDFACKLFDIAVTATLVMQSIKHDVQTRESSKRHMLQQSLMSHVHWVLGILLSVCPTPPHDACHVH